MKVFFKNLLNNLKQRFTILGISVILLLSAIAIFSNYGLLKRFRLDIYRNELNKRIQSRVQEQDSLKEEIKMLLNDSLSMERIAREKYGMVKPNEQIYFLPKNK